MPRTLRGMDAFIDPASGDYAGTATDTLANAVYLRLMTPLGSWWADPTLGSRLHELQREKDTGRVDMLARQYSEQALQPLLADGRASRVDVSTHRQAPGWLHLQITVEDQSGRTQLFNLPVRVA